MSQNDNIEKINKTLEKSTLSLKEQVRYVKDNFRSEGLLLTLRKPDVDLTEPVFGNGYLFGGFF